MKTTFTVPHLFACLAFTGLSACSGSLGSKTDTGFASVSGGVVSTNLDSANATANNLSNPNVGLVAYAAGLDDDEPRAGAYAGIQSGATVGAAQTGGTASYSGTYGLAIADNVSRSSSTVSAVDGQSRGSVSLTADFDAGTLTGTGSGTTFNFTTSISVDGNISGTDVTGTVDVTHNSPSTSSGSLTATLDGMIGADGTIGVFHGSDSNTVLAGGYVAEDI